MRPRPQRTTRAMRRCFGERPACHVFPERHLRDMGTKHFGANLAALAKHAGWLQQLNLEKESY